MKQLIYPINLFETSLTIEPPIERIDYNALSKYKTIVQSPKYKLCKTSQCLTKFVIEEKDYLILQELNEKANKALKDLRDNLILLDECHTICEKANHFCEMYKKAKSNYSEPCKGIMYIETADETSRGCQAFYRFNDGVVTSEQPCKVGDVLEFKYDPEYGYFSPIKITVNNG